MYSVFQFKLTVKDHKYMTPSKTANSRSSGREILPSGVLRITATHESWIMMSVKVNQLALVVRKNILIQRTICLHIYRYNSLNVQIIIF
jgi:hypothetical protein